MLSHTPFMCAMYVMLIMSTLFTLMSPNWLMAWIMLEINMLSFVPLMMATKSNQETEASIKYFLSQALGSMLMLLGMSMLYQPNMQNFPMWTIMTAMFIKLGMAPCHFWYPSVMSSLSWINCLTLSTWQKLAPLSLLMMTISKTESSMILMITASVNALTGGIMGMNQTHLRPLLAYSSIGHMGWMTSMLSINKSAFCMMYFLMYSLIVVPIFLMMNMINSKTIKTMYNMFKMNMLTALMMAICLLSLAGIPPLTGFIPKLMIMSKLVETNYMMLLFLLMGAYMNLYYYLNITFNLIMSSNNMSFKYENKNNYMLPMTAILSTSMMGMLPMII